jgi:hypothetical protein
MIDFRRQKNLILEKWSSTKIRMKLKNKGHDKRHLTMVNTNSDCNPRECLLSPPNRKTADIGEEYAS